MQVYMVRTGYFGTLLATPRVLIGTALLRDFTDLPALNEPHSGFRCASLLGHETRISSSILPHSPPKTLSLSLSLPPLCAHARGYVCVCVGRGVVSRTCATACPAVLYLLWVSDEIVLLFLRYSLVGNCGDADHHGYLLLFFFTSLVGGSPFGLFFPLRHWLTSSLK
jgi:hypothetical protein